MFKGVLIEKDDSGYRAALKELDDAVLMDGDTLVNVAYSTLNYKDALAISGKAPVVRKFPMIPGIDLAGTVISCSSGKFKAGDEVLLNGFGVGEAHCGGLAQKAQLKSDWLIALPKGLSAKQAMAIGTAGYTAMLCVMALQKHGVVPDSGEILVTGANGGVGSYAIAILAKLGYTVIAATGRVEEAEYLKALGASKIIDRHSLSEPGKPLAKERWAGVVDSVGSHTLVNACASTKYGGVVAACGLAQSMDLPGTVAPFILRGVTLAGIDSVMRPLKDRIEAWDRLAKVLDANTLDNVATEIGLAQVCDTAQRLLDGQVRGRIVVNVNQL
ncbi:MDR family oxidoreductase [Rheinheimera baltica]|uniref:acrylyl-CoA reductase (NADPH) n=1 Tax=Rheinheimera baltica TaxID=67576 RepID=UPI00040BB81A|nr:MDR family oxidoreductase [Rheinheimera baltica]